MMAKEDRLEAVLKALGRFWVQIKQVVLVMAILDKDGVGVQLQKHPQKRQQ